MVVKNTQTYGVQTCNGFASQKIERRHFCYPPGKTLSPFPIITLKAEKNYSFPQLRERTKESYFQMYCFLTEECTFC